MLTLLLLIVALPWMLSVANVMCVEHPRPLCGGEANIDCYLAVRNECERIEHCIDSLLDQSTIARIIVIDDSSEDTTLVRLDAIARLDARVVVLTRNAVDAFAPGKSGALASAISQCEPQEPWLLFTDADVRFDTGGVRGLLLAAQRTHSTMISAWLRCTSTSVWSRLLAPQVTLFLMRFLPFSAVVLRDARFAAANGQCMLIQRDCYVKSGGHAGLVDLVEDVALARAVKSVGGILRLASGRRIGTHLGYSTLAENFHGYGRSLAYGLGGVGAVLFALWQFGSVAFILVLCARVAPFGVAWILVVFLLVRFGNALAFSENVLSIALAPVGDLLFGIAAVIGAYERRTGGTCWRGRTVNGAKP